MREGVNTAHMLLFHDLMRGDVVMELHLWFDQFLLASDAAFVLR